MASAQSPSSSPRLPSPPPIAEDQIGPPSPSVSLFEEHGKLPGVNSVDTGASRRIRPGTKAEHMAEGPPLIELQDIESAFQLTEHLKALHYSFTQPPNSTTIQPITAEIARQLTTPPPNTSRDIWLYELGRFLIQKTNAIIVALFGDDPPCSAGTCPEMRASEWQYLCAVHDPPKSCAAIDYCCHTLDWASNSLSSSKMFPSRLGLGSGSGGGLMGTDKQLMNQMKEIKNIFRRVYRIYAHAWFQHREMFWRVEGKTGLYIFFKTVCDEYGIIEPENYTIPSEAEGLEPVTPLGRVLVQEPPRVLQHDQEEKAEPAEVNVVSMGDTTKRHRHTMSDLSKSAENIIQEEAEEEEEPGAAAIEEVTEPLSPKPSLGRHPTVLQDEHDPVPDETPDLDGPLELPRSETVKPPEDSKMVEDETPLELPRADPVESLALDTTTTITEHDLVRPTLDTSATTATTEEGDAEVTVVEITPDDERTPIDDHRGRSTQAADEATESIETVGVLSQEPAADEDKAGESVGD